MRKLKFVPLEERIVLDAAVANAVSEGAASTSAPPPTHILVIPTSVPDASHLADAAGADTAVVLYDPSSTSLAQLADAIAQAAQGGMVEKIGFVAEGKAGTFNLTNADAVNSSTLNGANTNLLGFWHSVANSLLPGGGIDILACDVASSNAGQQMLSQLASIINDQGTHFTLNASADITGSSAQGGNWFMEYGNDGSSHNAGSIYFDSTSLQAWNHTLATSGLLINSPEFLITHEQGLTDSFQVSLLSAPTTTVLVTINTNFSQIGLSSTTLTFNASNWSVAQNVTVSAVNNLVMDDTNPYIINFSISSADANFNNAPVQSLTAYHIDNDAVGAFVSPPSGLITTESGGTAAFTVYLQKALTGAQTVTIGLTSSDVNEGTTVSSIVMDSSNSTTGQSVTVTGVDDGVVDGPKAYSILTAITGVSGASGYTVGTVVPDAQLTNTNTNTGLAPFLKRVSYTLNGDITIVANTMFTTPTPPAGPTDGNNDTDMTYVDVDSNGTTFNSSRATLDLINGSSVVWAGLYWSGLMATGVDAPPNPAVYDQIRLAYGAGGYNSFLASTTYTQTYADGAVEYSAFADITSFVQNNGEGVYTAANIQASDGIVNGTSWGGARAGWTILVIYQNSTVAQHNVTVFDGFISIAGDASVGGGGPGSLDSYTVPVSGFVTPSAGNVNTNVAVILHDGEDPTIGSDQMTVNGVLVSDNIANGSISIFGDDTKPDRNPNYSNNLGYDSDIFALTNVLGNGQTSTDVNFTINTAPLPGDRFLVSMLAFSTVTPGFDISTSSTDTTEGAGAGHTATVTIKLSSQPTSDVVIPVMSSDTSEGTVSVSSVTFTSLNWDIEQTITVTGVDDALADGVQNYLVQFGAATSADTAYDGFVPNSIQMRNLDNELGVVTVTPTTGHTTTELGGKTTFSVVLNKPPSGDVTIGITSSDTTEGVVSTNSLVFTAANWNVAQFVTVEGVFDLVDDGDVVYSIITAAAVSTDVTFNGVNPANVSITNLDTADVVVNSAEFLVTHESGLTDSFEVLLSAPPTSTVTITLNTNLSQIGLSTRTLTFDASNWNVAQTVTVSAVDNSVLNDTAAYIINFGVSSLDPNFNNEPVQSLTVYHVDNDAVGAFVSPASGLTTTEDGGTATFKVYLQKALTGAETVTVGLTSSDTDEGVPTTSSVLLNASNSTTGVSVTVTGVDDGVIDGPTAYSILTSITGVVGASGYTTAVNVPDVLLTNLNEDTGLSDFIRRISYTLNGDITMMANGILTSPTPPPTGINNNTDLTYIDVDSNVATFNSSSSTLNLLPGSTVAWAGLYWGGMADFGADAPPNANQLNTVKLAYGSGSYTTLIAGTIHTQTYVDGAQDFAAFVDVTSFLQANGSGTYTVADLQVSDGVVGGPDWSGGRGGWTIVVVYQNSAVAQHNVTVFDGLISVAGDVGGGGPGGLPEYSVTLSGFVTPTAGDVKTSLGVVALDGENQDTSVAQEDIYVDGTAISNSANPLGDVMNSSISIFGNELNPPRNPSYDNNYGYDSDLFALTNVLGNSQTSATINFSIHDLSNPGNSGDRFLVSVLAFSTVTPGFDITPDSTTTTEASGAGHTATISIKLSSQPTADVTIPVFSSDTTEGTVSVSSVTFTAANWDIEQTITITGVDEFLDDGDQNYNIVFGAATSTDASYDGFIANPIQMVNVDNDTAGVTVNPTTGLQTTEAGGQATFTVRLNSQPTANVTIGLTSSDTTEGTLSTPSLLFTAANWNVDQIVTITGVNDFVDDGNITYSIITAPASSADVNYSGLNAANVSVTNVDNDTFGITIIPLAGLTTTEVGGTATFIVRLNSQPLANVTIGLTSSDLTEGTLSASSLTFTAANWNVDQMVTVTGVNDFVDDGNINYSIITGPATSADVLYSGLNAPNITATNIDNDVTGFIRVGPVNPIFEEGNPTSGIIELSLTSEPIAPVTVYINNPGNGAFVLGPSAVVFDATNWNTPHVFTLGTYDDGIVNPAPLSYNLTFTTVTTDPTYSLVTPEPVQVTINNSTRSAAPPTNPPYSFDEPIGTGGDDDGTGGTGGNGNNPFGGDEPFGSHPFGNDDPFGNQTGGVSEFSFLSRNRLAGFGLSLNDNLSFSRNLSSSGLGRSGFERVIFENQFAHNDASSLLYADPSIIITEAPNHEDAQVFFVNLTNAPTDTVNLSVTTSDPDNVDVSSNKELQFTPENWARPQEIRIDRSELTKHDFSTPLYIDISPAKSGDIDYNGMRPGRITIDRMNDDASTQKAAWNAASKSAAMMIPDLGYAIMQPHYDAAVDPIEAMEAAAIAPQKVAFHQVIDEYNLISQ